MLPSAATSAARFDALFCSILALVSIVSLGVFAAIGYFALRYRRRIGVIYDNRVTPAKSRAQRAVEWTWIIAPLFIFVALFVWSARVFIWESRPPANAMEIDVVAQQWMWKFEHPNGRRELDTLHLPLGRPVKLVMTSQDVIHSLFIPAFRYKMDVLPGRYTEAWFEPSRLGTYHLFCAQYCGTSHASMEAAVVVMTPADYAAWLAGGEKNEAPEVAGAHLFQAHGCASCHGQVTAPSLAGIYGTTVALEGGGQALVDDDYLRESILAPHAKIVSGYKALMPTFAAQLGEDDVIALVRYLKTLRDPESP
jgi:cytochrome c oxidase subunit 2